MLVNSPRLHHHTFPLLHYFIAIILVPCNRSALFLWFSINIAQKTDIQMRLFVEQPCKVEAASLSSTFSELEWNWLIKSLLLKTLLWFRVYYRQRFVPCCWFFFWLIWRSMYSATVWIKALQLGQLHDGEMKSAGSRTDIKLWLFSSHELFHSRVFCCKPPPQHPSLIHLLECCVLMALVGAPSISYSNQF